MKKELIKLKGTVDGVKIYIDSDGEMSDILTSLYEKLRQFRKFFGEGHCNIYFAGRALTESDKMRLEAVVTAMLPESTVNYGERKQTRGERYFEETLELPRELKREEKDGTDEEEPFRKIKDVVTTNFKSSRARFYEGVVRAGKAVESDGHLVLVGDVEEGGKIAAVSNVVVLGSVRGSVEAGCMGNDNAYIIALDFNPTDVRISKIYKKIDNIETENPSKKAYLINNEIFIEDFW
ncbi:MAG: hypothetical protein LUF26_09575 [Firmicutes bacterium]|nr:hypothetical protein [Bacillota bacterium]